MTSTFDPTNELYSSLSPDVRQELGKIAQSATVAQGSKLVRHGVRPEQLIILDSGKVEITVPAEGKTLALGTAGPGKVFALRAIVAGEASEVEVIALERCSLTVLPAEEFLNVLRHNPEMYMAVVKVLSGDLQKADSFLRQKAGNLPLASGSRTPRS
jgi:CRP-like cAMP-binding protein